MWLSLAAAAEGELVRRREDKIGERRIRGISGYVAFENCKQKGMACVRRDDIPIEGCGRDSDCEHQSLYQRIGKMPLRSGLAFRRRCSVCTRASSTSRIFPSRARRYAGASHCIFKAREPRGPARARNTPGGTANHKAADGLSTSKPPIEADAALRVEAVRKSLSPGHAELRHRC